jgi:RimJ/RimL family protein N-acetyltransferase
MPSDRSLVFETERLRVRAARVEDTDFYYTLWTNPKVMSNVGFPQGLRITRQEIEEKLASQPESEFGRLLVAEIRATGEVIGECKMRQPNAEGVSETDVKLLPAFWGHKYGVEVKRGLVAYLFTHTDCEFVQATPNVGNIASIRMQEAVGGVRIGEGVFEFPESMRDWTAPVRHYVYRVYRTDWEKRQAKT